MTTDVQLVARVQSSPVMFERMLIMRAMHDAVFARKIGPVLFVNHLGAQARSICTPRHIGILHSILDYHAMEGPAPQIAPTMLWMCLTNVAKRGLLAEALLNDDWQYLSVLAAEAGQSWDNVKHVTNLCFTSWLRDIRAKEVMDNRKELGLQDVEVASFIQAELAFVDRAAKVDQTQFGFGYGIDEEQPDVVRLRTSIPRLNHALGGGFGKGEGFLIIAASGAGKTVLSTQLASTWSLTGSKGLIITTERSQDISNLTSRIVSQHCRIPYGQIHNGLSPHKLQETQRVELANFRQRLNHTNMQFCHWWLLSNKSIKASLRQEILKAADSMGGIDYFVLDWIGGVLGDECGKDKDKLRLTYQESADLTAQIAGDMGIVGVALAQAHAKMGRNNPRVDPTCLAECKSMDREMTGVIGVSFMEDKTENAQGESENAKTEQVLHIGKARKGPGGGVPVARRFAYQKFTERHAQY